jgi:hypothetical protein
MRKTNKEISPPPHVELKEIQSNWDVVIFKITPLKDVVKHVAAYVLRFFSSSFDSVKVIESLTTDTYSSLDRTRVLHKTRRVWRVEEEDTMYQITTNIIINQ